MLDAKFGAGPAGVEEHKDGPDVVARRNRKKHIDAMLESLRVLSHTRLCRKTRMVSCYALGQPSSRSMVTRRSSPPAHFQLIDSRRRQKFAPPARAAVRTTH